MEEFIIEKTPEFSGQKLMEARQEKWEDLKKEFREFFKGLRGKNLISGQKILQYCSQNPEFIINRILDCLKNKSPNQTVEITCFLLDKLVPERKTMNNIFVALAGLSKHEQRVKINKKTIILAMGVKDEEETDEDKNEDETRKNSEQFLLVEKAYNVFKALKQQNRETAVNILWNLGIGEITNVELQKQDDFSFLVSHWTKDNLV